MNSIAIGVALHNGAKTIKRCLDSILCQKQLASQINIVIGDDNSTDNWKEICNEILELENVVVLKLNNNSVCKTRNDINQYIVDKMPDVCLIGRLDADDEFAGDDVIHKIEDEYNLNHPDVILAGNYQRRNGVVCERTNKSVPDLLDTTYLIDRLRRMCEYEESAELPSCNIFMTPQSVEPYPSVPSAEDHHLLVYYLLNKEQYKISIMPDLLLTIYDLGGTTTINNKKSEDYILCRKRLYEKAIRIQMENKKNEALRIIEKIGLNNLRHLGSSSRSEVFTDETNVFKLSFFQSVKDKKSYLKEITPFLETNLNPNYFYDVTLVCDADLYVIIKYKYEEGDPCEEYSLEQITDFLSECWISKIIIQDCKPLNFIKIGSSIKLIDMEGSNYTDNLFLNMCARMYLYATVRDKDVNEMKKIVRSSINRFDIPELVGFREFVNSIFSTVIFKESNVKELEIVTTGLSETYEDDKLLNFENIFFQKLHEGKYLKSIYPQSIQLDKDNYFSPKQYKICFEPVEETEYKISLLIKTCPQDVETIVENVKHIVKQLSCPNTFHEIIVSVDTKTRDFLRMFNKEANLDLLLIRLDDLKNKGVITKVVVFDESKTKELNKRWFNLDCQFSHTSNQAPVAPQLYAFEQCDGDYILQMDSDVMIGRMDYNHSYLNDMVGELISHENVVSVGFNIPNYRSNSYYGFENGGFVPEVRMGLFDKRRFFALRPFENSVSVDGKLTLTWHRALQKTQELKNFCSIRGGDRNSFYIHPQNYRKKDVQSWMLIEDRVEQNILPQLQYGKFDCEGSLYDWCGPKRNEKMVVVSVFRNVSYARFLRMWHSLISQSLKDFGIILYDDNSDNGLPYFIDSLIAPYRDRVTFIKSRYRAERMENMYRSIHYYMQNPESIVVCLDGDDAFIGNSVLEDIFNRYIYWNCDVTVGRMHQTYRIQPYYRYPVDFVNPRAKGGNVWQHTKTFKKYLFDSIPLSYFKHNSDNDGFTKGKWYETTDDYAFMVPIVEMSSNPVQMDLINYYYERDFETKDEGRDFKEKCIAEILNKPALNERNVFKNRKQFFPTFKKIELDITYECNLKCMSCNRSCAQVPTKESVTLDNIRFFIQDSINNGIKWNLINVLGGEPTLHPDFKEIIEAISSEYVKQFSQNTIIQIVSNGLTERSRQLCEEMRTLYRCVRIDYDSYKTKNKVEYFSPFNDAPRDDAKFKHAVYTKACWVTTLCGIGFNARGYYACALCGGIDRILNTNSGYKELKELTKEHILAHYEKFCPYCGNYKDYDINAGDVIPRSEKKPFENIVSMSWQNLYGLHNDGENE